MFGKIIDYWILRPFVHSRKRATEEELNARFVADIPFDTNAATLKFEKLVSRFEGRFPISDKLHYLDIGCGDGGICIALAKSGCEGLTGVDIIPRAIERAKLNAVRMGVESKINFICKDINEWEPDRKYDIVLSYAALEHISRPKMFLQRLSRLVTKDGTVFLAFGPLFHAITGDHLSDFFRVVIPWRGVLFSEKALLRLRSEFFRPGDPVDRFEDTVGGHNRMRYSEFLDYVNEANLDLQYLRVNPQLKRFPLLYHISNMLIKIPRVRDYVPISVYAMLKLR